MAQHDYVIANDTAANVRADINSALAAIVSNNSGATAPATTYANQWWYDTANNILKLRTESDDAWMSVAYLDDTGDGFRILDDTQVVNTSGTQTGLIGDQSTATWEAGTSTTQSLVSPANVKSAIEALVPAAGGMTLFGTLTTTSGTSVTLSGLTLTDYKQLSIVCNAVSGSAATTTFVTLNGYNFFRANLSDPAVVTWGGGTIDLTSGIFWTSSFASSSTNGLALGGESGLTTASTSITFTISTGNFDAGSILVYGVS